MGFYADGSVMGESVEIVVKKLEELKALSDRYNAILTNTLGNIGNIKIDDVPAPQSLPTPSVTVPKLIIDKLPKYTKKGLALPTMPILHSLDGLLSGLDGIDVSLGDMPDAPQELALDLPTAPTLKDIKAPSTPSIDLTVNLPSTPIIDRINLPVRPAIDTSIDLPPAPDMSLPDMARLFDIELPVWEEPNLPVWDESLVRTLDPAKLTFNHDWWREKDYQSDLYDKLLAAAGNMLDPTKIGNFGLPDGVVNVLFNKPRERLAKETKRAIQEATTRWASRGFSLPSGVLDRQIHAILDDENTKVSELNAEIFVQATKEQMEQLRFAITQGLALEQHTFNIFDNMVKRLFEVARYNAEAQFKVFDYYIQVFNANNESYKLAMDIYKSKMEMVLSKLTIYKAKIEAQTAIGGLNSQLLEIYKAKLQGVQANAEIFKTLMQGASIKMEAVKTRLDAYRADLQGYSEALNGEKLKFELYKTKLDGENTKADIGKTQAQIYATQMEAYKTQVQGEQTKLEAYDSRVKGELAKAQIYDTQVKAYGERLRAYQAKGDVGLKQIQIKTDLARSYIAKYSAELDGYKANLQANLSLVQSEAEGFRAGVDAWRSKVQMQISNLEMQSRWTDMQTRTSIAFGEMKAKEYEALIKNAQTRAQIALEQAKSVGGYAAQLAAGAMSAGHISASISASGSASTSQSKSESTSTSHNYSY